MNIFLLFIPFETYTKKHLADHPFSLLHVCSHICAHACTRAYVHTHTCNYTILSKWDYRIQVFTLDMFL